MLTCAVTTHAKMMASVWMVSIPTSVTVQMAFLVTVVREVGVSLVSNYHSYNL